uniref:Chitin-binding type-2 domain-containing protein n=1 Tax=Glossina morsitans morsitans TaxID=37546 RepID=A0A1B0FLW3_GLOMM
MSSDNRLYFHILSLWLMIVLTTSAQKEEFQCPSNIANGNYADPVTCRRFYQCVDGFPYLNRCPSGLYFDDVQKFCTFKDEAKCGPLSTSKSI